MRPRWNRLQSIPQSVGPAGVEPAFHRVSDGRLAARLRPDRQRPVRDSNPSRLLDRQVATPAASQGGRVSGGSRTRLSDAAGRCLGCSATDTVSKGGRSRTLCARVGAALLSQEHALVRSNCPGRTRTCNRLVNSEPLYHLSYKARRQQFRRLGSSQRPSRFQRDALTV
jgi:hypothetical protein